MEFYMKKGFSTVILFFVVLVLMAGIIFFGMYIYTEFLGESSGKINVHVDKIIKEVTEEIGEEEKISINSVNQLNLNVEPIENTNLSSFSDNYNSLFFYNQLEKNQKIIYDALMQNKQFLKKENYKIEFKDKFKETMQQENGTEILGKDFQAAIEAFIYDNPDLFYLDIRKMNFNMEKNTKLFITTYNVYISPSDDKNYLYDIFQTEEDVDNAIIKIEQIKQDVNNKLKGTDYKNILFIHDFLINSIEYDTTYNKAGNHTIYGALIMKQCVCEGYAKAFKYLANSAGIECELLTGIATNSEGESENHLWNCVKLNDIWYQIDLTWDDPIVIGGDGKPTNEMKYKFFLKGTDTFGKDHTLEYQFSEKGRVFSYPELSKYDYK